jgi:Flp pilus assembly protein TadD
MDPRIQKSRNPWDAPGGAGASPIAGGRSGSIAVLLAAAGLVLLLVAVYASGVRGEFLGPDHALFQHGPFLDPPSSAGAALPQWLPRAVTSLSLALDRAVWGPFAAGFRRTNLILHVLATLALFALFLEWTQSRLMIALPAALLFAIHPIHVEAVEVVGARGEILAALFGFLSLLMLARARRGAGGSLVIALTLFFLATFSSPTALAIPVFLVCADAFSEGGLVSAAKSRAAQWALFAAAALPAVSMSLLVSRPVLPLNTWLAGRAALLMTWLLAVPVPLSVYRIIGPAHGLNALSALALLAALGLLVATALAGRRLSRFLKAERAPSSAPLPLLFQGWLLALVPVALMSVPWLAPQAPGPDVPFPVLDPRLYLPSAGMCLALAAAIALLAGRSRTSRTAFAACTLASLCVAVPYGALLRSLVPGPSSGRPAPFRNDVEYYAAAATQEPRSAEMRIALAHAAAARGQTDRAIQILAPILEQRPGDANLHLSLGNFHRDVHDLDKAESEVREALKIDPKLAAAHNTLGLIERDRGNVRGAESEYREAVRIDPSFADAHSNLGALLVAYGAPDEAMTELRRAVDLDPTLGDAAANLASFLLRQNLQDEALAVLREGLRYSEGNARLHYHVGVVLQRRGDRPGAQKAYERAILLDPTYARPMNNLAVLLTEQKQYADAITLLQRIAALEPQNEQVHYNLGIAYRLSGDRVRAAAEFGAALKLRPDYADASRALTDMAGGAPPQAPPPAPPP